MRDSCVLRQTSQGITKYQHQMPLFAVHLHVHLKSVLSHPSGSTPRSTRREDSSGATPSDCTNNRKSVGKVPKGGSLLDQVTHAAWDERAEQGLFKYDVRELHTKVLPGKYGFLAQFNEGRHSKKRPTEFTLAKVKATSQFLGTIQLPGPAFGDLIQGGSLAVVVGRAAVGIFQPDPSC